MMVFIQSFRVSRTQLLYSSDFWWGLGFEFTLGKQNWTLNCQIVFHYSLLKFTQCIHFANGSENLIDKINRTLAWNWQQSRSCFAPVIEIRVNLFQSVHSWYSASVLSNPRKQICIFKHNLVQTSHAPVLLSSHFRTLRYWEWTT